MVTVMKSCPENCPENCHGNCMDFLSCFSPLFCGRKKTRQEIHAGGKQGIHARGQQDKHAHKQEIHALLPCTKTRNPCTAYMHKNKKSMHCFHAQKQEIHARKQEIHASFPCTQTRNPCTKIVDGPDGPQTVTPQRGRRP